MRELFRLTVRHGTSPVISLERDDEVAGLACPGEFIICFPDDRASCVERVMHDLNARTTYCLLRGVIYDSAEQYVKDLTYLREHGWKDAPEVV